MVAYSFKGRESGIMTDTPAEQRLLKEADEILKMARDLLKRGLQDAALGFALTANQRLQAVKAFREMNEASLRLAGRKALEEGR